MVNVKKRILELEVQFTDEAKLQYLDICDIILRKFGQKSRNDFKLKLDEKFNQLSEFQESCPKYSDKSNIFKAVLTKQTTLFYTVDYYKKEIWVISVFDTRQDPDKLTTAFD